MVASMVNTENVGGKMYKFTFLNMEDKRSIFGHRSWTLNGAHLIVK